jgi:chromosome segregation ATPase
MKNNDFNIDWAKAEEKPEKKLSVEGQILLEFRSKIKELELELETIHQNLAKALNELDSTKDKLAGRERSLTELTERKSIARKSHDQIKEEKLHADIEIAKLSTDKSSLEEKLTESVAKITALENQLNKFTTKSTEIDEKILTKDKEIQNLEEERLHKVKELLNKEQEIQKLKTEIDHKNEEIVTLKQKLNEEKEFTDDQIKKYKDFEAQVSKAVLSTEIIEKIKKLMELKGFLSDKELESLLNETEE